MRGQSKKMSLAESLINVAIGYEVALLTQVLVFPLFGIDLPISDGMAIAAIFTAVSIARSYVLRRLFNWIHCRKALS